MVCAARQPHMEEIKEAAVPPLAVPEAPIVPESSAMNSQPTEAIRASHIPEHPFQSAKDAAYAPSNTRNVGAPIKPSSNAKRTDLAYKTLPLIHDATIAAEVYKRSMDTPITITQRELLSLSPDVRSQVREITTTHRIPNNSNTLANNMLEADELNESTQDTVPTSQTFAVPFAHHRIPPEGSIITTDPFEAYYQSLRPGEMPNPDRLIVSMESVPIRSIFALVDNSQKKECTLDPGCQIIAMSEAACHELSLAYDLTIKLNMQSANGTMDMFLGLAHNVAFRIGTIILYMQVHIIRLPAYDILLGRPFDILTESIVRNFANEDQTITINDTNTGQRAIIPTFPRKSHRSNPVHCWHWVVFPPEKPISRHVL